MGKVVQVLPQYSGVYIAATYHDYSAGMKFTLRDDEYAALLPTVSRTLMVVMSGVPDPVRGIPFIGPTGAQGSQGPQGSQGSQGSAGTNGPNSVSTSTTTTLNGVLKGNGANIAVAGSADIPDLSSTYASLAANPEFTGRPNFEGLFRIYNDVTPGPVVLTDAMLGTQPALWSIYANLLTATGVFAILHAVTGTSFSATGLIGMAPDGGGVAYYGDNKGLVDNSATFKLINTNTNTTYSHAYGFYGQQASTTSPLFFVETTVGGTAPLFVLKATASTGNGYFFYQFQTSTGVVLQQCDLNSGRQDFFTKTFFSDTTIQAIPTAVAEGVVIQTNRAGSNTIEARFYQYGSANNYYPAKIGATTAGEFDISTGALGTTTDGSETYTQMVRISCVAFPGLGFYGAAPTAQAARAGQLTDSTGGTVTSTLAAGITDTVAKNAIASLSAKVNALELVVHNLGLSA